MKRSMLALTLLVLGASLALLGPGGTAQAAQPTACGATAPAITATAKAAVTVFQASVQPCTLGTAPNVYTLEKVTIWAKWLVNGTLVGGLTVGIPVKPFTMDKIAKFRRPAGATAIQVRTTYIFIGPDGFSTNSFSLFGTLTSLPAA